jgi:hypothetical protein
MTHDFLGQMDKQEIGRKKIGTARGWSGAALFS